MLALACIALVSSAAVVVLPTRTITLGWVHTVEKTRWEEDYLATADGVTIVAARIEALGAGMEPPHSAIWDGRWWRYRPLLPSLSSVELANSTFAEGYSVCWSSTCQPLVTIVPQGQQVSIRASKCTEDAASLVAGTR